MPQIGPVTVGIIAGIDGQLGIPGRDGEDAEQPLLIPGLQGPQGNPGAAGLQGIPGYAVPGEDGSDALPIPGRDGTIGQNGLTGPQGPIGYGLTGDDGEIGQPIPGPVGPAGISAVVQRLVASGGAPQTGVTSGSSSTLPWGARSVEIPAGQYDAANKQWVCPSTGLYIIAYSVNLVNQTAGTGNFIRSLNSVNGGSLVDGEIVVDGHTATNVWGSGTMCRTFTLNDTVKFVMQVQGATADVGLSLVTIAQLA